MSNTDPISDEAIVIKQYAALIKKLIPFQQQNKLLEGVNKFSGKVPSRIRNIIKEEVIRLTSLTDASADNSDFAKFPVLKFKHFGIPMRLDKVGKKILEQETDRYLDRYTVGVFESIMNSDHYKSEVKREQQQKIIKAFNVESQTFKDIDFGNDLAIRPNFTVFCQEFEKGKSCSLSSFSFQGMVVETKKAPVIDCQDNIMVFTFPAVAGFTEKTSDIKYEIVDSSFNKSTLVFESTFQISASMPKKLVETLAKYIKKVANQFPLERELEIERVMQDLERDRILTHSPWIPVFIGTKDGEVCPIFELMTATNANYNDGYSTLDDLPGKQIFKNLIKELQVHQETFLLKGLIKTKKSEIMVAITHRQLIKTGLMKQFIEQATRSGQFHVIQFRLQPIKANYKEVAYSIHDIIPSEYSDLGSISHVLFCKDVTNWIGNLQIDKSEPLKPFPRSIIDDETRWPINIVMEEAADRRMDARYVMNTQAIVKTHLFKKHPATINDLSANGIKLTLSEPAKIESGGIVRISVKELNLSNQIYRVVEYNQTSGIIRLRLPSKLKQNEGQKLKTLFNNNKKYFMLRDLSIKQRNIHRFLWELSIRNLPCASVLITNNRFTLDRLKTVYHKEDCFDLNPFAPLGNEVPLHGFFADKDAQKPSSSLLDMMLKSNLRDAHVIHAVRNKDNKIIYVKEEDFLYGKIRDQISSQVAKNTIEACVTHISSMRCTELVTPLTSKRLAQISKIDLDMYEKIKAMQKGYTHVLYITNVSNFHNALLRFGIYSEDPYTTE